MLPDSSGAGRESWIMDVDADQENLDAVAFDRRTLQPAGFIDQHKSVHLADQESLCLFTFLPFALVPFVGHELRVRVPQAGTLCGYGINVTALDPSTVRVELPLGQVRMDTTFRLVGGLALPFRIEAPFSLMDTSIPEPGLAWRMLGADVGRAVPGLLGEPGGTDRPPIRWATTAPADGQPQQGGGAMGFPLARAVAEGRKAIPEVERFFSGSGPHVLIEAFYFEDYLFAGPIGRNFQFNWNLTYAAPGQRIQFHVFQYPDATLSPLYVARFLGQWTDETFNASWFPPRDLMVLDDTYLICRVLFPHRVFMGYHDDGVQPHAAIHGHTFYTCGNMGVLMAIYGIWIDAERAMFRVVPIVVLVHNFDEKPQATDAPQPEPTARPPPPDHTVRPRSGA
jgi:hypothetical protein